MTTLPEGIVTNSDSIGGDIRRIDTVDVDDIAHLWRAYTTNKNLIRNDTGSRLENLFWRIWSCKGLYTKLSGATIARLFQSISEDHGIIRTTPVQSPQSSVRQSGIGQLFAIESRNPKSGAASTSGPCDLASEDSSSKSRSQVAFRSSATPKDRTSSFASSERAQKSPLPPILKKTRDQSLEGSSPSLLPGSGTVKSKAVASNVDSTASLSSRAANKSGPPSPSFHRDGRDSGSSAKRKKATFASASATRPGRPVPFRRKSSQSSSSNTSSRSVTSPKPDDLRERRSAEQENASDAGSGRSEIASGPAQSAPTKVPQKPLRLDSGQVSTASGHTAGSSGPPGLGDSTWVVEQGFRSKFADKSRHERTSTLLTNPSQVKTSATLASTSMEVQGTLDLGAPELNDAAAGADALKKRRKGKGKERQVTDGSAPLKAEGASGVAVSDEEESAGPLSRTKSQLTLLLERDRLQHGNASRG
ncbi:MAG: hypothetical protein M1825_006248 [Sarcosagium campestre]|nr:MAG: hypothetical protein M1825_006248 [Sarcosagium campestre]